jgi:gallate dioxygenase
VHGERCGFINTPWDMEFLERLEKDPEGLTKVTIAEYATLGGMEGAEVVMWLLMRGALSKKVKKLHQTYYVPSMTAISSVIFEEDSVDPVTETDEQFRTRMMSQYAGLEKLEGTYPYVIERSVKAFRLNRFLHSLIKPEFRKQFLADPAPLFEQHKLTAEERELVVKRDWRALMHYGVIFFLLEKLAAVVGTTNLHVYAAMRGQSLEDFLKTRNTQVLYSVAGNDESKKSWDKPAAKA